MVISKIVIKNERYDGCPLCGAKIELVFEEQNGKKSTDTEISGLDLIKEEDWLLP